MIFLKVDCELLRLAPSHSIPYTLPPNRNRIACLTRHRCADDPSTQDEREHADGVSRHFLLFSAAVSACATGAELYRPDQHKSQRRLLVNFHRPLRRCPLHSHASLNNLPLPSLIALFIRGKGCQEEQLTRHLVVVGSLLLTPPAMSAPTPQQPVNVASSGTAAIPSLAIDRLPATLQQLQQASRTPLLHVSNLIDTLSSLVGLLSTSPSASAMCRQSGVLLPSLSGILTATCQPAASGEAEEVRAALLQSVLLTLNAWLSNNPVGQHWPSPPVLACLPSSHLSSAYQLTRYRPTVGQRCASGWCG